MNAHWEGVKRVFRYLKGTADYGLVFNTINHDDTEFVQAYCDADFAGDSESRKSTSGFVRVMNGTAICWSSKRQSVVALSTAESEYITATVLLKR